MKKFTKTRVAPEKPRPCRPVLVFIRGAVGGVMAFKAPRVWFTVSELCKKWDCTALDLLHLAQTQQLSLYVDWHQLERNNNVFTRADFFFVHRKGFSDSYPSANFIEDVRFVNQGRFDASGREKYQPVTSNILGRMAYASEIVITNVIENNIHFGDFAVIESRNPNGLSDWYTNNTGLFVGDYELICEYEESFGPSIKIDNFIVLNSGVENIEKKQEQIEPNTPIDEPKSRSDSVLDSLPYNTKLLELLFKAMKELFPEDRKNDPPKAIAVAEMMILAEEMGVDLSKNIADAIFTVIKPDDHNPKKRRDEGK